MNDHTRYEVNIKIDDNVYNIFVAVPNYLPDESIDQYVKNEVFDYIKKITKYTYSQKLI